MRQYDLTLTTTALPSPSQMGGGGCHSAPPFFFIAVNSVSRMHVGPCRCLPRVLTQTRVRGGDGKRLCTCISLEFHVLL